MAFKDLVKQQRLQGSGILSSVGSAASASARESLDIRNALFSSGSFLNTLFPKVKGFKAGSNVSKGKTPSLLSGSGSDLSSAKLDQIGENTKIAAKNSFVLPAMARDMNVMRQNIVKLVKLQGGTASTKADMFFMKAGEREAAYENRIGASKESTSPTKAETPEKKGGGILGMISGMLGAMGFFNTLLKGLLVAIGAGVALYFASDKFSNFIDEQFKSFSGTISRVLEPFAGPESSLLLMVSNVVSGFGAIGKAISPLLKKLGLLGTALTIIQGKTEANEMQRIREKENESRRDPSAPKLTPEEQVLADEDKKRAMEIDRLNQELIEPYDGQPSAAAKAIKKFLRFGVGEGDERLRNNQSAAPAPTPAAPPLPAPSTAPTPAPANTTPAASGSSNLMDIIAAAESGRMGYDAANKGKAGDMPGGYPGLSKLTVDDVMRLQSEGKLFATGRYQIIPKTLAGLMKGDYGNTGVKGTDLYDASTQDKLVTALINNRLKQGGDDPIKQQFALSQEFASIENPYTGKSYYAGKGNNKASIGTSTMQSALGSSTQTASSVTPSTPSTPSTPTNTMGASINAGSVQVADARMNMGSGQSVVVNAPQTNVQSPQGVQRSSGNIPSVVDTDFMRHLVAQLVS